MRLAALLLFTLALPAAADVVVPVCHGYGCIVQDEIRYSEAQLTQLTRQLAAAVNPENGQKSVIVGKPADKPGSVPLLRGSAIIPLGLPSPTGSSNLPGSSAGHASASLFGLAPDGVYRAVRRYRGRGELLPRRFTLT